MKKKNAGAMQFKDKKEMTADDIINEHLMEEEKEGNKKKDKDKKEKKE